MAKQAKQAKRDAAKLGAAGTMVVTWNGQTWDVPVEARTTQGYTVLYARSASDGTRKPFCRGFYAPRPEAPAPAGKGAGRSGKAARGKAGAGDAATLLAALLADPGKLAALVASLQQK